MRGINQTLSYWVSLEAELTSLVIDAKEGRDVAIFGVPGAYLNAFLPDSSYEVILSLRSSLQR